MALLAMVGLFWLRPPLLDRLELLLLDWRFQVRGEREPVAPVVIAAIDATSIDALGRWPWRRSVMADLIDRLTELGAVAIGVDVVFSEPEVPPEAETLRRAREALAGSGAGERALGAIDRALAETDTDARLEQAIRESGRVALGFFFRTEGQQAYDSSVARGDLDARLERVRKAKVKVTKNVVPRNERAFYRCTDVEPNLARFSDAATLLGFFSTDIDPDGVIRRAPLVGRCGDDLYISLDLAVVSLIAGGPTAFVFDPVERLAQVRAGRTAFPTDEGGAILIDYRGPPRTFPHHPIVDILEGRVGRDQIEGRVVLVGPTEAGIQDVYPTPFHEATPGIEIHANVIDNLIAGEVLRREDGFLVAELATLLLVGALLIVALPRLRGAARGALFALVLLAAVVGAITWLFATRGLWINLAYPVTTLGVVYLAVAVTHAMTVEAGSRMLRQRFSTYVSPQVAEEMIQNPDRFRLGGERRDLSILFSDVAGFTTISEEIGAENVVELMNAYLGPMTQIVLESRGTLDKYIGDAVMAFWGAPLEVEDHPTRVTEAALAMQAEVLELKKRHPDLPGMDRLEVRIGIHAAEVVVGNMGSEGHFAYTLTGDGVNVCARLEGLNKYYGTLILASGDLVDRLPQGFLLRELDTIRVKGRLEGVRLVEVIGRREPTPDERRFLEAWDAARDHYRAGRWGAAREGFAAAQALREGRDGACTLLIERCEDLQAAPPEHWDGVWAFQTK